MLKQKVQEKNQPFPYGYFSMMSLQWVTLSNNDPRAIWEICNYDLLLIDLKISSHICWPFRTRTGVGRAPTPSLQWSELCLDSLTGHLCTSDQWKGCKRKIWPLRGLYPQSSYIGLCYQFNWIIFQPCWWVIKAEIGCFANGVTRELVSNFFGMSPSFYGLTEKMFQAVKKNPWTRNHSLLSLCLCQ